MKALKFWNFLSNFGLSSSINQVSLQWATSLTFRFYFPILQMQMKRVEKLELS